MNAELGVGDAEEGDVVDGGVLREQLLDLAGVVVHPSEMMVNDVRSVRYR